MVRNGMIIVLLITLTDIFSHSCNILFQRDFDFVLETLIRTDKLEW